MAPIFWKPTRTSIPPSAEVTVSDIGEARLAAQCVAFLLRVFGEHALVPGGSEGRAVSQACDTWGERVVSWAPSSRPTLPGGSTPPPALAVSELLGFFSSARSAEQRLIGDVRRELEGCVRSFSQVLARGFNSSRARDEALLLELELVRRALEEQDHKRVALAAERLVTLVSRAQAEHSSVSDETIARLRERLLALEDSGPSLGALPGALDPVTRLRLGDDLQAHLGFVAALGQILRRPGCLHLFAVDEEVTSTGLEQQARALAAADEVVRVFVCQDHYLARIDSLRFAAVTAGNELAQAHAMSKRVHQRLVDLGIGTVRTVTVFSVADEDAATWWERARGLLDGSAPGAAVLGELPAQFDDG